MMRAAILSLVLLSAGCTTASQRQISVPVPIECRVQTPVRPGMPTERLVLGVDLDAFVAAAQAEIEIREGYEIELNEALSICTTPVKMQ